MVRILACSTLLFLTLCSSIPVDSAPKQKMPHIFTPSNGSLDSIRAAVAMADTGDVVLIPAGTWDWKIWAPNTPSLTLLKPIHLKGAGHEKTIIIGDTTTGSNERLLYAHNSSDHLMRISNIKFRNCFYGNGTGAAIVLANRNWRIDHCVFDTAAGTRGIAAYGTGLVDSCYFYDHGQGVSCFGINAASDKFMGDSIWAAPGSDSLGTGNAIFIENCKFYFSALQDGAFDSYVAKVVFRYNYVENTNVGWHGFDTGPRRSAIGYEIYHNTFTWKLTGTLFTFVNNRGGTGVIYNNTCTGIASNFCLLQNYRSHQNGPDHYMCNGSAPTDGNDSTNGWPCYDQIGRGVNQTLKPVYLWGNTLNGSIKNPTVPVNCKGDICDTSHIHLNRDYFLSEKPGYKAFEYPHPFRKE